MSCSPALENSGMRLAQRAARPVVLWALSGNMVDPGKVIIALSVATAPWIMDLATRAPTLRRQSGAQNQRPERADLRRRRSHIRSDAPVPRRSGGQTSPFASRLSQDFLGTAAAPAAVCPTRPELFQSGPWAGRFPRPGPDSPIPAPDLNQPENWIFRGGAVMSANPPQPAV